MKKGSKTSTKKNQWVKKNHKKSHFEASKTQHVEENPKLCILADAFEQMHESTNGNYNKPKFNI